MDYVDLPSLNTLQLHDCALQGDSGVDRRMISNEPYNFINTLTMKSENE